MSEVKLVKVEDKNHIDIPATVEAAKQALESNPSITLVARQTEIARIGMIIKKVEEECNCKVSGLKHSTVTEEVEDKQNKDVKKEYSTLYFRATLTKN